MMSYCHSAGREQNVDGRPASGAVWIILTNEIASHPTCHLSFMCYSSPGADSPAQCLAILRRTLSHALVDHLQDVGHARYVRTRWSADTRKTEGGLRFH
jgi:hypothetical protein